jgi:hypothetical protein
MNPRKTLSLVALLACVGLALLLPAPQAMACGGYGGAAFSLGYGGYSQFAVPQYQVQSYIAPQLGVAAYSSPLIGGYSQQVVAAPVYSQSLQTIAPSYGYSQQVVVPQYQSQVVGSYGAVLPFSGHSHGYRSQSVAKVILPSRSNYGHGRAQIVLGNNGHSHSRSNTIVVQQQQQRGLLGRILGR